MEANFFEPRYNRDGKIVALADVVVAEGIVVKGFRIVRGEQGLFASVPTRSFVADGKTRFLPQVTFTSPEHRSRFLAALLEAFEKSRPQPERRSTEAAAATPESHPPADELVE
jgi:DNA-binding cell septation regulator SpoVG